MILLSWVTFTLSDFLPLFHFSLLYSYFLAFEFCWGFFLSVYTSPAYGMCGTDFSLLAYRLPLGGLYVCYLHYENLINTVFRGQHWGFFFFWKMNIACFLKRISLCFSLISAFLENTVHTSLPNIFGGFAQLAPQTLLYDYFYFFFLV